MRPLKARFYRFWHCLWHTLKLEPNHCSFDFWQKLPGEKKRRLLGCTCGRIWYSDFSAEGDAQVFQEINRILEQAKRATR